MIPASAIATLVIQPEWLGRDGDGVDFGTGIADEIDRLVSKGPGKVRGWLHVAKVDELEEMPCLASVRYVRRVVLAPANKTSSRVLVGQLMVRCPRADVWAWLDSSWHFYQQRARLPAAMIVRLPPATTMSYVSQLMARIEELDDPGDESREELRQLLAIMARISVWAQEFGAGEFDELGSTAEGHALNIQRMLHPKT